MYMYMYSIMPIRLTPHNCEVVDNYAIVFGCWTVVNVVRTPNVYYLFYTVYWADGLTAALYNNEFYSHEAEQSKQ